MKGSVIATSGATSFATSRATSRGVVTLLNYARYNPLQKEGATSRATSGASSTAAIENKSIQKENIEVPESPSAPGKQPHGNRKNAKPEPKRHPETKPTTDHIWQTFEAKKGFKPEVNTGFWKRVDTLVQRHGGTELRAAWDFWLADAGKFAKEAGHSPQTFVAAGTINQYLSKVKEQCGEGQEAPYYTTAAHRPWKED